MQKSITNRQGGIPVLDASRNIGNKFNEDGSVRFFPGNTILSFVDHDAPVWAEFNKIRDMLKETPASHCMTLLPDESIHMTVFEGVCHQWRRPDLWTNLLPLDCTLTETDDLFERAYASVKPLGQVRMRMDSIALGYGVSIRLVPVTEADAQELRRFRDECPAAMGIRHTIHDTYKYHLSMAYLTTSATDEEEAQLQAFAGRATAYIKFRRFEFTITPPCLTFFDNMFKFNPYRIERNGL